MWLESLLGNELMRKRWLLVAVALATGSALAQGPDRPELPPGHPPIDGASPQKPPAELPSGHPAVKPGAEARNADDLLNKLDSTGDLKQRVKTFEIAASIGRLYYSRSRYSEAAEYFGVALDKAEPSRQLFLQQREGRLPERGE